MPAKELTEANCHRDTATENCCLFILFLLGFMIKSTYFSYHSSCVPYVRSLVVYISARLWLSPHKTLVYSIRVAQGSLVTCLM